MGKAFYNASANKGITQDTIASKLNKDKSIISKILRGHTKNLTIKTLAEMSLAMDCDLDIQFRERKDIPKHNYCHNLDNYASGTFLVITHINQDRWQKA